MEWEMKMPPWDLAELGRDDELGHRTNSMDCSVDLKLGGSENSEMLNSWKNRPGRSTATTTKSSPAPLKRSRSVGGAAACLVDGCNSDLSNCREYHRRHKVCEMHAKTPIVMVKGQEQRFCQQCSRFHPLMEFDEVKRSCRKRLDGHNRRRRKPQPDTINAAHFFHRPRFPSFSPFSPAATKTEDTTFYASLPAAENGIHSLIGPDSACALSLLSSPIQYPDGAAVAEAEERIPMGQPLGTSFFYRSLLGSGHVPPAGFSCAAGVEEAAEQAGGAADGGFHGQGFFHLGIDGASSRPFPFSWQ